MSEKKARASVFFVIAIIAFICSCILFSMTGGVSDWIGDSVYNSENSTDDFGLSEFIDQSEGYSTDNNDYSSSSYSSESENSDKGYDSSKFFKDLTKHSKDSSSSDSNSNDESKNSDKSNSDSGSNSDSNNDKSDSI